MTEAVASVRPPTWRSSQPVIEDRLTRLENQMAGIKHRLANDVPDFRDLHRAFGFDVKETAEKVDEQDAFDRRTTYSFTENMQTMIERLIEGAQRYADEAVSAHASRTIPRTRGILEGSDPQYHLADILTNKRVRDANNVYRKRGGYRAI